MADDNNKDNGGEKPQQPQQPQQATASPSLVAPQKTAYKKAVGDFTQQLQQMSLVVTQLQAGLLQLKTQAIVPEFVDGAMEALVGVAKSITAAQQALVQSATPPQPKPQPTPKRESFDPLASARRLLEDKDRVPSKERMFFVRQTQVHPKEHYEVREAGELAPVHVYRCPKTGAYECDQDEAVSRGKKNRYVEAVKHWAYRGKPKVVEFGVDPDIDTNPSGTPADTSLSGGGYERPGFWGTHQPVGYPDMKRDESITPTNELGQWNDFMDGLGFKVVGPTISISRNGKHYVLVNPDTDSWTHRSVSPALSINGTGRASLERHLKNLRAVESLVGNDGSS